MGPAPPRAPPEAPRPPSCQETIAAAPGFGGTPYCRRGGGTLVIARSHRIVSRFAADQADQVLADTRRMRLRLMRHHPWLRALATPDYDAGRTARFTDQDGDVDGIAARVVELTGKPGDVVITHPWMVHHAAFNAAQYPRLMRGQSIYRATAPSS